MKESIKGTEKKEATIKIVENDKILSSLKKNGVGVLKTFKPIMFEKGSKQMEEIAIAVEEYLNFYVDKCLKEKGPDKLAHDKIEANVQAYKETFKATVESKRKILHAKEIDREFASSMKEKISEVRKYKYKKQEHMDGHKRNPFVQDDLGV